MKIKKYKRPLLMAKCDIPDQEFIKDAIVRRTRGSYKNSALLFCNKYGLKKLCRILHSMRRWYTYNPKTTKNIYLRPFELIKYRKELSEIMNLNFPSYPIYRGIRFANKSKIKQFENIKIGDTIDLEFSKNKSCSSWSSNFEVAEWFATKDNSLFGIAVKLIPSKSIKIFVAPPSRTKKWFDDLYKKTMGMAYRYHEDEFGICSTKYQARVVEVFN